MANTILERIQDAWRGWIPAIDNARNIAEAVGMVSDYIDGTGGKTFDPKSTSIAEAIVKMPNGKGNTILERLQEWYETDLPDAANAKNIAEAIAMNYETGGTGAGSILSVLYKDYTFTFLPNGGEGEPFTLTFIQDSVISLPECPFTPPEGKQFAYWILPPIDEGAEEEHIPSGPYDYSSLGDLTLYAGWEDVT